ncbi:A/G-specific adenine glycosylase [Celerinatantimonas diazotrophica]|uniref:Adenine DNA glycosylase n=1 Tax=Celerinatantimonas diazotrophica TaxID=412034 RepID=A0A4R1J9X9_9GAMM|nr:A/G-specific adenine glycosylase [Celerinatantimonas diazotrophica]TCK47244.1 A/G-specific DNA-adenine glycosylase [Celerinatantimonas diazotrophica]CAG9296016.1 Adenine DNA glycosylase [Celerinatantimonas diazotrophica]
MKDVLSPEHFNLTLVNWASKYGRHDLPWQQHPTPYSVHVSEIMLQQTQVTTVIEYFKRWMSAFPNLLALANADEDEVMSHWQGLGYYSRARNLQKAARYLVDEFSGHYPRTLKQIEQIPGVGRYTAGAIVSFAYNERGPIVDGNVRRLFCRYFAIEGVPSTTEVNNKLWQYAEHYTLAKNCRAYAQSLLDMGAMICTPKSPDCPNCPINDSCQAYQTDRVAQLPTPKPKKHTPTKIGQFLWIEQNNQLYLQKRPAPGIWAGLWCLPQLDTEQIREVAPSQRKGTFKHVFSHYKLDAEVLNANSTEQLSGQFFSPKQIVSLGLPTPIRKFIGKHLANTK